METTKRNGIIVAGTLTLDITPVFESKKKAKSVDEVFVPGKVVHMEGMDIRTIARTLRIRESAVKSRLHRGREKLRQSDELKELLEDE